MVSRSSRHCLATTLLLFGTWAGCGGYGSVSPEAYEYAKALYSITNRQSEDSLDKVRAQLTAAHQADRLPNKEAAWLIYIVDTAAAGDWKAANRECREMMEDQVRPK